MSCYEIERQNYSLLLKTIFMSGDENVQLPLSIVAENLVQTAIDNIDHYKGRTLHTDGSHDTIMVVFQNYKERHEKASEFNINYEQKSLICILPSQVSINIMHILQLLNV